MTLALEILEAEIADNPPQTQEEICLLAARFAVAQGMAPVTDQQFMAAAFGQARGLFGPAFDGANEAQKIAWIDMCERALRQVVAE